MDGTERCRVLVLLVGWDGSPARLLGNEGTIDAGPAAADAVASDYACRRPVASCQSEIIRLIRRSSSPGDSRRPRVILPRTAPDWTDRGVACAGAGSPTSSAADGSSRWWRIARARPFRFKPGDCSACCALRRKGAQATDDVVLHAGHSALRLRRPRTCWSSQRAFSRHRPGCPRPAIARRQSREEVRSPFWTARQFAPPITRTALLVVFGPRFVHRHLRRRLRAGAFRVFSGTVFESVKRLTLPCVHMTDHNASRAWPTRDPPSDRTRSFRILPSGCPQRVLARRPSCPASLAARHAGSAGS